MPSKTVHLELTITALSLGTWNYVNRIDLYILQHITDPDSKGMEDGYLIYSWNKLIKGGLAPHHGMKEITDALRYYYFWNSVCYYLKGDYERAGESLARAIHYSQDTMLIYSGYDPRHDIIEGEINEIWNTQKDSIIKEVLPELNKDKVFPEPTSTPKYYLPRALQITYYMIKEFEEEINSVFVALAKGEPVQRLGSKYLLWALGYENLDITRRTITETKRIGRRYKTYYYDLVLQPYVKPCRS